jgi:Flp pilus assembly protein TadD
MYAPPAPPRRSLPAAAGLSALLLFGAAGAAADVVDEAQRLHRSGQSAQALELAERTIAAQPREARLRFLKGVILTDQQRRAEAEQVFAALTEDFPELADPYNNLAVLYAADGRLQAALAALQAALRNDPAHRAALENLGDVHLALAIESWSRAASGARGDTAALQRKLRMAREITPPPPAAGRPG